MINATLARTDAGDYAGALATALAGVSQTAGEPAQIGLYALAANAELHLGRPAASQDLAERALELDWSYEAMLVLILALRAQGKDTTTIMEKHCIAEAELSAFLD